MGQTARRRKKPAEPAVRQVWLVQVDKPRISVVLAVAEDGFEIIAVQERRERASVPVPKDSLYGKALGLKKNSHFCFSNWKHVERSDMLEMLTDKSCPLGLFSKIQMMLSGETDVAENDPQETQPDGHRVTPDDPGTPVS